ncbi:MAG: hypothetical protein JWP87_6205 [Labilithrix sp.]|nr:hypothetical protein [Labilithrix sp.]
MTGGAPAGYVMRMGGPRSISVRVGIACIASIAAVLASVTMGAVACVGLDGLAGGNGDGAVKPPLDDAGREDPCEKSLDDDHDNCGACGTVCGGMEHCLGGKCAPGCPDHVVYVSADGNDNASGCTTKTPKRTVGAALALLKTLSAQKHEVHVCRGQYDEAVALDYPTSILGAYECSTWKRSTSYGAPTFDGVNESVIRGTPTSPPLTASSIEGIAVDGLTLRAADATSARLPAVVVQKNAKLKLTNTKALAGGGNANDSPGSVGLLVDTGAFADIASAIIDGGAATNKTTGGYGSAGIFITAKGGGVHVADARILGGGGIVTSGTGSIGILALGGTLPSTVERSNVNGGTGHTGVGSASYGTGFFGAATDVTVVDSIVTGGASGCTNGCAVTGLAVSTAGKVTIRGNRITGGEAKSDMFGDISFTGLHLTDYLSADVQNNSVFSGNTKAAFSSGAAALELTRGAGNALVANNTLAVGPSKSGAGSVVIATSKTATFVNNLFLYGTAGTTGAAVALDACAGRTYALNANAWVGFPAGTPLLQISTGTMGASCTSASDATVDALQVSATVKLGQGTSAGNTRLVEVCADDTHCIANAACSTASSCIGTVLTAWDKTTAGDLLGAGWTLKAGVACAISLGGTTVPGLATSDGYGVMRTSPFSMGANEHDTACTK